VRVVKAQGLEPKLVQASGPVSVRLLGQAWVTVLVLAQVLVQVSEQGSA
jgi:hypothetical protein